MHTPDPCAAVSRRYFWRQDGAMTRQGKRSPDIPAALRRPRARALPHCSPGGKHVDCMLLRSLSNYSVDTPLQQTLSPRAGRILDPCLRRSGRIENKENRLSLFHPSIKSCPGLWVATILASVKHYRSLDHSSFSTCQNIYHLHEWSCI